MHLGDYIPGFASLISNAEIEVHNEASVALELAIWLRAQLPAHYKVQVERNIRYFGLDKQKFVKQRMDLAVFRPDSGEKHSIEIKFPTQGQYPVQMFKACEDVRFLEQLTEASFDSGLFLMFATDSLFYGDKEGRDIYDMFRSRKRIEGTIRKSTGKEQSDLVMRAGYEIEWRSVMGPLRYFQIEVSGPG